MAKDRQRPKPMTHSSKKSRTEKPVASERPEAKSPEVFHGSQREFLESLQPGDKLTVTLPSDRRR